MNTLGQAVFVLVLLFVGIIGFTTGLECYDCSYVAGLGDKDCLDPFKGSSVPKETCKGVQQCFKSDFVVGNHRSVHRRCTPLNIKLADECQQVDEGGIKANQCYCSKHKCNGGTRVSITAMGAFILTFIPAIRYYVHVI